MDLLVFLLVQEGWESNSHAFDESIMKTDLKIYVGEVYHIWRKVIQVKYREEHFLEFIGIKRALWRVGVEIC